MRERILCQGLLRHVTSFASKMYSSLCYIHPRKLEVSLISSRVMAFIVKDVVGCMSENSSLYMNLLRFSTPSCACQYARFVENLSRHGSSLGRGNISNGQARTSQIWGIKLMAPSSLERLPNISVSSRTSMKASSQSSSSSLHDLVSLRDDLGNLFVLVLQ